MASRWVLTIYHKRVRLTVKTVVSLFNQLVRSETKSGHRSPTYKEY